MFWPVTANRRECGQTLLLFVLALGVLIGFVALAIDVGLLYEDRRHLQNTADAAALAGVLGLAAPLRWSEPGSGYLLLGSLLFLNGPFGVTLMKNLPLNNRLAAVKPKSAEGASFWTEFRATWGLWNHVRWIGSLAAAASFIWALVEGGAPAPSHE